jgi:FimV-like protein
VASYLDMGDQIGASKLLQDIIQNGNDLQQARARKMLSDLK